jgi:hypothetical protein
MDLWSGEEMGAFVGADDFPKPLTQIRSRSLASMRMRFVQSRKESARQPPFTGASCESEEHAELEM